MSYSSKDIQAIKAKRIKAMQKKNKVSTGSILWDIFKNNVCTRSMAYFVGFGLMASPFIMMLVWALGILNAQ